MNDTPIVLLEANQLTPVDLDALRRFWDGLQAIELTLRSGAPGKVYISISTGLYDLLESHYGKERSFHSVMANVWVQDPRTIKQGGDVRSVREERKRTNRPKNVAAKIGIVTGAAGMAMSLAAEYGLIEPGWSPAQLAMGGLTGLLCVAVSWLHLNSN